MRSMVLLLALTGCGLLGGGDESVVAGAEEKLKSGDIAGAIADYDAALAANPESADAAVGSAYGAFLKGDLEGADKILAAAEAHAGEKVGEVKLRRALVALKGGDTDAVREHATASNLPAGKLLVAEVALADGERDEALKLLQEIQGTAGGVGATAKSYLELLEDSDPLVAGLAENYALWALGQRKIAAGSVEEVVKGMPDDRERKAGELLLWSGRAATSGEPLAASGMLEAISFPPTGQAWRVPATRAIILCSEGGTEGDGLGNAESCRDMLKELEGKAPSDGLRDARITAAMVLGDKNPAISAELLEGVSDSSAAALAALRAGDKSGAASMAPKGAVSEYVNQK